MIGVFDSGFGGLTVLKEITNKLPQYDYVYLGDSARAPFGNKSQEIIYKYTQQSVKFLFSKGCELVIIACNTASAKALRKIQQEWLLKHYPNKRVLGVIIPVIEAVAENINQNDKVLNIGVIGTQSTINSCVYENELKKISSKFKIYGQACPLLVPLIEEGWIKRRETIMILRYYLRLLKKQIKNSRFNFLILGCTHYPILHKQIQTIMGKNCKVLNSPLFVAIKLEDYLRRHLEIESKLSKNGKIFFYATDDIERFKKIGNRFLGKEINNIKKVYLK